MGLDQVKDYAYFDLEIEVTDVARVWLHAEDTSHFITLLAGEIVVQVEYCLLPVSVPNIIKLIKPSARAKARQSLNQLSRPSLWSGGEAHPFVAFGELDVEVGDQRLHVVVALDLQVEGGGEGDVLLGARLDVDLLDQARVRHNLEIEVTVTESIPFKPKGK